MKILAIETSCDETAAALIEADGDLNEPKIKVLNKAIHSQIEDHIEYGGVYPTVAKREHTKNIAPVVSKVLDQSRSDDLVYFDEKKVKIILEKNEDLIEPALDFLKNTSKPDIDMIAVTSGPGLEPALWVGINFAKALSFTWNIPLMPINHMEGHIASVLLNTNKVTLPSLALLISGGHTELVKISNWDNYEIIGKTKDDAVGESFDKVARMLGFPYPGGPEISRLAQTGRDKNLINEEIKFPRPMINSGNLDFSFSGLKTAVLYKIKDLGDLNEEQKIIIAKEFEDAVTNVLVEKVKKAVNSDNYKSLIVAGGVVANRHIRKQLSELAKKLNIEINFPDFKDCTDNAQMIAVSAYLKSFKNEAFINPEIVAEGNKTY